MNDKKYVKGEGERGGRKGLGKKGRMVILYLIVCHFQRDIRVEKIKKEIIMDLYMMLIKVNEMCTMILIIVKLIVLFY